MNSAAMLQNALDLENRGRLTEAIAGYEAVLKREPGNVDALFLLGRAHIQLGRTDDGARLLRRIVAPHPRHAAALTLLGLALERDGRPEEALANFEHALAIVPNNETALTGKADALAALGRHADALSAFDRALALDAGNIAAWCNRGLMLETLGRDGEAAVSFERALALKFDLFEAHFNLANALHRLNRNDEAVTHYRHAIALRPDFARTHANLGVALHALGRWQQSIDAFTRADELQPGSPEIASTLGELYWHRERFDDALAAFDRALSLRPDYAEALNRKGRLLYVLGRLDEARALMEEAVAREPDNPAHYLDLTEVKRFGASDPQLAAMESLLPDLVARQDGQTVKLHFALAKAYRDTGAPEASFRHLLEGNALKRRQAGYDEGVILGQLDRIREVFTPELMSGKAGHGDPSQRPIFIIGMPRSGTTLVEQILAGHRHVAAAGERTDFGDALDALAAPALAVYPDCVAAMTLGQIGALGAGYVARMAARLPPSDRFTDKLPHNFLYAGLIHLALPQARLIHCQRDPADTCLSCFSTLFKAGLEFTYDLAELGRYYVAYERLMAHWRGVLPAGVMLEVRYEDVVRNLEAEARRIHAHCGLGWDEACLDFHKTDRPVATASAAQVRQPLYRSAVGRWQPYSEQLRPLLDALGRAAD
jgi:tetratricopeptide (TPR) repeat protein